jgi:nicotinamide-nucleotide amidase
VCFSVWERGGASSAPGVASRPPGAASSAPGAASSPPGAASSPPGTGVASGPARRITRRALLPGNRADIRDRSVTVAMHLLRRLLLGESDDA